MLNAPLRVDCLIHLLTAVAMIGNEGMAGMPVILRQALHRSPMRGWRRPFLLRNAGTSDGCDQWRMFLQFALFLSSEPSRPRPSQR